MANGRGTPSSQSTSAEATNSRPSSTSSTKSYKSRPLSSTYSRPNTGGSRFSRESVHRKPVQERPYTTESSRASSSRLSRPGTGVSTNNQARTKMKAAQIVVNLTVMSSQAQYEKVKQILVKPSEQRIVQELNALESWFRKKSKLFVKLKRDTLLDVIKHCEFRTVQKNDVVIEQGYKGNEKNFYIVLRGKVAVLVKDEVLDEEDQLESNENITEFLNHDKMETDRTKLGEVVNHISDGGTFGELALINDDDNRMASIVADEVTDLICISREVYDRSVGKIMKEDFQVKLNFVEKNKLFRYWSAKWRRQLATCIHRKILSYDEILEKQGANSDHIYFILKGELKLVTDPEMHKTQYREFMEKMTSDFDDETFTADGTHYGLEQYFSVKSRQAKKLKTVNDQFTFNGIVQSKDLQMNKIVYSPSAKRKLAAITQAKSHRKYNVCYLEAGQYVGDVEFLIGLPQYHGTAISTSHDTVVIQLHRVQFNRYFQKKYPETVDDMTRHLGIQMPRRLSQEHINKNIPLLKCILARLDDLNGTNFIKRKPKYDDDTISLGDSEYASIMGQKSRGKSGKSTKSNPQAAKKENKQNIVANKFVHFGFNLPELPEEVLNKYLNTQVRQVLQRTQEEQEENNVENTGDTPAENAASLLEQQPQKKIETRQHIPNIRDGIFFKVLQVSNPNINKDLLAIEEEEFNYLCQIKRRIAKELHNFYPFASLESFLSADMNEARGGGRTRRRMVQSASAPQDRSTKVKKSIPSLAAPKRTVLKTENTGPKSAGAGGRKNVGFAL